MGRSVCGIYFGFGLFLVFMEKRDFFCFFVKGGCFVKDVVLFREYLG